MSENKKYNSVSEDLYQQESDVVRDTRPLHVIFFKSLIGETVFPSLMAGLAIISAIFPALLFILFPISIALFFSRRISKRKERLPMRLPVVANKTDFSDMKPGRRGFAKGLGIFYLGVSQFGEELWLKAADILTHLLVLGTTGSGKTVTLTALSSNYLAMGGGLIYTDPKAAPGLWRNFHMLARMMGRDDDLRVQNFMTANTPSDKTGPERFTNTTNPFAFGNADMLTQLLNSLIEVSGGDNAVFGQNAMMAVASLMLCLVDLRDKKHIELSITTIRDYFEARKMTELAVDDRINTDARDSITSFLKSMGWQPEQPYEKQPKSFGEQFQYAKAYYGLALNSLSDTYGHIYRHLAGEVDLLDVIKNRRILLNMLPSLEKSPAELKQLGKIILSATRNAISVGLGDKVEGSVYDVTESLPLSSPTPFGIVTDEYAAIPTPGFAEVMTQGRGLGISSLTGTQDLDGMMGDTPTDKRGAMQVVENTKIKIGMKLAGGADSETWRLWKGLADEAYVMQTQGASVGGRRAQSGNGSALSFGYEDGQSTSVTKISRINLRDMQEQNEGEFHAFINGAIVRGDTFFDPLFDNPNDALDQLNVLDYNLNIVRLMYVEPPNLIDLNARRGNLKSLLAKIVIYSKKGKRLPRGNINPVLAGVAEKLANTKMNESKELVVISAFMEWVNSGTTGHASVDNLLKMQQEDKAKAIDNNADIGKPSQEVIKKNSQTRFAPVLPFANVNTGDSDGTTSNDSEAVQQPSSNSGLSSLSSKLDWMDEDGSDQEIATDIADTEKHLGKPSEQADSAAENTVGSIKQSTQYPTTPIPEKASKNELDNMINKFIGDEIG
jgi:intracellular multiplication protein IcmO